MKSVIGHSLSKKHVDNTKSSTSKSQRSIKDAMRPIERDPVKIAELRIAVYIAEHASALSVDHLGELLPKLDMKSRTLQDFRMHHTKCARLQKYVIAPSFAVKLRNEIGDQFFSLVVDESTNEANISCLALCIRFYSTSKKSVVDTFYRLLPIENATADTLYQTVKRCLAEDGLDVKKMIGLGTDGASSMIGRTHSLSTLLRVDNPELTLFRCVCHSLHLAASKASECLPIIVDFVVRETHNWFSTSPKRTNEYQAIYRVLENSVPKKVPGLAGTRWLASLEAVSIIIDQWEALKLHFDLSASKERCYTAKTLSDAYRDDQNKLYLLFVRKTERNSVNKIFQSQK
ncbi:zinc finger protein 862-like [Oratosquilla oratoria]|uniref:zinc finger protein 862-like n=1 Tax=Oratosquilla oratoria TaxID=337810 RepID=UPI003F76D2DB